MTVTERSVIAVAGAADIYDRLNPVRNVLAPTLTDPELSLFAMIADRTGLDPFARQIYAVKRAGKVTFQTGIDGYRSIAARTGLYDGQDEPEYGPVCPCGKKPDGHPEFATVRVYRKGVGRPIGATAYWHEYKPEDQDFMWVRMPRVMIAKVAEALALRKGFPYDPERRQGIGADVYTADEMAQAGPPPAPIVAKDRIAARRAALEQPQDAPSEPVTEDVAEDATFREGAPVVASEPTRCAAPSPHDAESEPCARESGHPGFHKNHARETWDA